MDSFAYREGCLHAEQVDLQQLANEPVQRELVGVLHFPRVAFLQVFHFRSGAQQLIPVLVGFGAGVLQQGRELVRWVRRRR